MHSRISSKMDSTRRAGALARGLAVAAALVAAAGLSGCRGQRSDDPPRQFLPDMDDQPKWKAQQQTQFFADGRTMRPPVAGTVAFGRSFDGQAADRAQFIREDEAYFYGLDGAGQPVAFIPESAIAQFRGQGDDDAAAMLKMIARGRERYNIYCAICHSYNGDGQGIVGQRWSYSLPNYHDEIFRDRSQERGRDGHMYRVARWGLPDPATPGNYRMPPYYDKVNERDAWAIVAYIRTLQASWTSDLDAVPAMSASG